MSLIDRAIVWSVVGVALFGAAIAGCIVEMAWLG